MTRRAGALLGSAALGITALAACHDASNDHDQPRAAELAHSSQLRATAGDTAGDTADGPAGNTAQTVGYGDGPDSFRVRLPGHEIVAEGPSAIALDAGGAALVLDRLAGRVVQVAEGGRLRTVASVAVDAMDLAAADDGSFVAFSPVRASAWLMSPSGASLGELKVPRELHELQHLELGPSRMVTVRTAYQERIDIGSPSAPLPLPVALATKREGSLELPSGEGVAVRVSDDQAELLVSSQANGGEKARIERRFALAGKATAARIVGVDGNITCVRIETVTSAPAIAVERRLSCIDAVSAAVTLERALPAPGLYLPTRELVVGHGRVAMLHPTSDGVTIHRWMLDATREVQP
jgi:hypothetical protein